MQNNDGHNIFGLTFAGPNVGYDGIDVIISLSASSINTTCDVPLVTSPPQRAARCSAGCGLPCRHHVGGVPLSWSSERSIGRAARSPPAAETPPASPSLFSIVAISILVFLHCFPRLCFLLLKVGQWGVALIGEYWMAPADENEFLQISRRSSETPACAGVCVDARIFMFWWPGIFRSDFPFGTEHEWDLRGAFFFPTDLFSWLEQRLASSSSFAACENYLRVS